MSKKFAIVIVIAVVFFAAVFAVTANVVQAQGPQDDGCIVFETCKIIEGWEVNENEDFISIASSGRIYSYYSSRAQFFSQRVVITDPTGVQFIINSFGEHEFVEARFLPETLYEDFDFQTDPNFFSIGINRNYHSYPSNSEVFLIEREYAVIKTTTGVFIQVYGSSAPIEFDFIEIKF